MAGAFHGVGEPECVINVGVSGPGVVAHALKSCKGESFDVVAETVKRTAFQITRVGQLVAMEASRRLNVPFGIVDLSLAPTPAVGDSVAAILEEMGLECCGTHGTTAALALLNDAVKKGGVMASSNVGGLSGPAIKPVAVRMVYQVANAVQIPIIGMGGIANAEDALEFILAGATAVSIGAMNFVNPYTTVETVDGIESYMKRYGIEDINTLIGAVK